MEVTDSPPSGAEGKMRFGRHHNTGLGYASMVKVNFRL